MTIDHPHGKWCLMESCALTRTYKDGHRAQSKSYGAGAQSYKAYNLSLRAEHKCLSPYNSYGAQLKQETRRQAE